MKTIIHVVQHLQPGGIETMVLDMIKFSPELTNTYIVSLEGDHETAVAYWPRLDAYSNQLIFLDKAPGLSIGLVFKISKLIKSLSVDMIHTHHIGPLLYGGLAAKLAGVKHIIHTEHDAWHLNNQHHKQLQHRLIKMIKPTIVADANLVAENLKQKLHLRQLNIIPNGIDTERFMPANKDKARSSFDLPLDIKLIGCGGRLEFVKGQHILIEALSLLPFHMHLALAGIGSQKSALERLANALGVSERVHFLGLVDDMPTFYQALDVFCLPSLNEGYPLSPLEAQSCGIASLVTDVGASKETLCKHSGRMIEPNNPQLMAKTLYDMLQYKTDISPREYVVTHADIRLMVQRYSALSSEEVTLCLN